ncbi:transcriptional repressor [Flammeovirga yaeyamensis]|uniref:Transcriptional repressor n=1 Tax=Flammeovirga yaeyamensis TaxID=367791 RepID=A0AAX1N7W1_9BACT|nr:MULTISPECIES: transcriptional repressor [Flammeovirga]ANQ48958.1 transcriptional repressor [Flammeovirga sp. MY04]MBB3699043.1 Fur family ferric uptake transcriptional regulator [Flammeovirga yaeyamensis]NMF36477.1 transcriptional repressor [Flammeovirga yaeyamensis]QWG03565.1 transcriptional repressor [Flammeovirga yaeyamensis]
MSNEAIDILNNAELRRTASRVSILDIFMNSKVALSENILENQLEGICDRATIYRTLKTFINKGILHRVIDENNIVKFAMCNTNHCSEHDHSHDHVHFKCQECGDTECMDDLPIQSVTLPNGYKAKETNYLILGVCKDCNKD